MSVTYPVVAAIDFGTHGTGYAWTEVSDNLDETLQRLPNFRETWPGTNSFYLKDLSAVLLGPAGDIVAWGHEAKQEWARRGVNGDSVGYGYASAFKMALKPDSYPWSRPPGVGTAMIDSVTKAYPLVVAYLRRIYQMALKEIQDSGYLEKQIRWCLTVPAIWDDAEKQLMRDAASEAGLPADRDRLLLAIEPEVAAVYCRVHLARVLGTQQEVRSQVIQAGTRFMVIDCGGGTVDITAFRVEDGPGGRSRMTEIGKVSGGKLGSEYINQAFIDQILRDRLGGRPVLDRIQRECPHALLELVESWESQKITAKVRRGLYDPEPAIEQSVYTPIPGEIRDLLHASTLERLDTLPRGSRNRIAVTPEETKRLFDTVVDRLIELVEEELMQMIAQDGRRAEPERLLLVGGLSRSEYLQERLLRHFGGRATLLVPPNPAAAVLFGAVLYGCDPPVIKARRSRYTYGCQTSTVFEAGRDPEDKRFVAPDGVVRCRDRFNPFVTNGDTIEVDQVTTGQFSPVFEDQEGLAFQFYRTESRSPRYVDEPGSEMIGNFSVDLGTAMQLPLEQREVVVELRFGGTDISVSGTNPHTGQKVRTTLRFDMAD
jgi:hypothetical protein